MQGNLVAQILVGVLINAIFGILCWLGKQELSFFRRILGFSPSLKKNVPSSMKSRINYQHWKLFHTVSPKSPLKKSYSLVTTPKKISYAPALNQTTQISKKNIIISLDQIVLTI
jgi:hypothetical protein